LRFPRSRSRSRSKERLHSSRITARPWDGEKRWDDERDGYKPTRENETFFESRLRKRNEAVISPIWDRSPLPHELESSSSDEDTKKRHKKNKKSGKKAEKSKKSKKEKKHKDRDSGDKKNKRKKKKKKKVSSPAESDDSSSLSDSSDAAEAPVALAEERDERGEADPVQMHPGNGNNRDDGGEEDDEDDVGESFGPAPPPRTAGMASNNYGQNLLPGEGSAMAAFVQEGKRIPRRGEIGLRSDEIEAFEDAGYVMSGSRNRRMEAVRMRKENQIYSVEERAALAQFNFAEKQEREKNMLNEFRRLVNKKLGDAEKNDDPFEKR